MKFTLEYQYGDLILVGPKFYYLIESVEGLLKGENWFQRLYPQLVPICEHAVKMAAAGRIGHVGEIDADGNVHLSNIEP